MGLRERLFGRKKSAEDEPDPLADFVLAKLKVGYLVDYDLQTWRVTGYSRYRFSGIDDIEEWELTAGTASSATWSAPATPGRSRTRSPSATSPATCGGTSSTTRIRPRPSSSRGAAYRLDASYAGHLLPDGNGAPEPVIRWEFVDEAETGFVGVEQWGETEFTAAAGSVVEDYQFTHILPGSPT